MAAEGSAAVLQGVHQLIFDHKSFFVKTLKHGKKHHKVNFKYKYLETKATAPSVDTVMI